MLIGFIGLPNSGKTTIASKLFSHLKENASVTELLVEQARLFIAERRATANPPLKFSDPITLTDADQLEIARRQKRVENYMKQSCDPRAYVIADSSVQNSALYVSDDYFNNESYQQTIANDAHRYDLMFYCHPFEMENFIKDSNRVHSSEQINALRTRSEILLALLKKNKVNVKEIMGTFSLENRFKTTLLLLTEEHHKFCQSISDDILY